MSLAEKAVWTVEDFGLKFDDVKKRALFILDDTIKVFRKNNKLCQGYWDMLDILNLIREDVVKLQFIPQKVADFVRDIRYPGMGTSPYKIFTISGVDYSGIDYIMTMLRFLFSPFEVADIERIGVNKDMPVLVVKGRGSKTVVDVPCVEVRVDEQYSILLPDIVKEPRRIDQGYLNKDAVRLIVTYPYKIEY